MSLPRASVASRRPGVLALAYILHLTREHQRPGISVLALTPATMPLFGSNASSSQGGPSGPTPPSLPRAPRPERSAALQASASQSHVDFLFSQVRACLHQLHLHGNLLARDYAEINNVLDRTELKQEDPLSTIPSTGGGEGETAEQVGKRNEWMRHTVSSINGLLTCRRVRSDKYLIYRS